jgi:hypothetical protein
VKGDLGSPPSDGAPDGTAVAEAATGQQDVSVDAVIPVTDPTADDYA